MLPRAHGACWADGWVWLPAAGSNRLVLRLVGIQIYQAVAGVLLAVLSAGGVEGPHPCRAG